MKAPLILTILFSSCVIFVTSAQDEGHENAVPQDTIKTIGEVLSGSIDVITPPPGYDTTSYFNGYINAKRGSSILINELAGVAYTQLESGMNEAYYSENGFEFISKNELQTTSNTKGLIYKMRFSQREISFIRYVVFAGDGSHTVWMHVTYAESLGEELDQPLLDSFKTIDFYPLDR